jgi:HemY protein
MRRIVLVILAAAIVLAVAWGLAALPGRLTIEWGDTTLEAATPVAALALLVLIAVAYFILRLLAGIRRSPRAIARARAERRRRLGDRAVSRTLLALAAGDSVDARRSATHSRRLLGDTPQTLLLSAEAGRLAGREDEAEIAYRKLAERPDAAFLGYRGLMRQAVARRNWPEAAALARRADIAHPGAAWLRQERAMLAVQAGNWIEALELADTEAPKAALATGAAQAEADPSRALKLAQTAWKKDPALPPAAITYAEKLRLAGRNRRADVVLRKSWLAQPHPDLAAVALAPVTDPMARAKAAQALTQKNPDHIESRLLVARTSLDAGLVGEARHQIEAARASGCNTRRLWLLLAEIEEEERGSTEAGRVAVRDALRHAADADAEEGWRCSNCHTPQPRWSPACPACSTPGSLRWTTATPVISNVPAVIQRPVVAEPAPAESAAGLRPGGEPVAAQGGATAPS